MRNSLPSLSLLLLLVVVVVSCSWLSGAQHSPYLVPRPQQESPTGITLDVDATLFAFQSVGFDSATLSNAFSRYYDLTFLNPMKALQKAGGPFAAAVSRLASSGSMVQLNVNVTTSDMSLTLNTDESYVLNVTAPISLLTANTVFGALRGLETFSQLVQLQSDGSFQVDGTNIYDFPRFHFRGYMIDTARHYLPVTIIYEHLDAMAYSKMNVLHWHIVDDQSFPYVSRVFPNLSAAGAYSPSHVYTPEVIKSVISYAYERGIRVVVEFDTPGHTEAWGPGQPGLLTQCTGTSQPYGPINPTVNTTYTFLQTFFNEVAELFPDQYLHLGGDEVNFDCWQSNPEVQAWMAAHNYTNYADLEQYYETSLLQIIAATGKQYIIWQDVYDNGVKVLPDTVVDVWQGGNNGWAPEVESVTASGLRTILSAPWYLNYISYGSDWTGYYATDPGNFTGTPAQKALMMGGEVCMWAEFVDATNSVARTWPRACAPAERFWSAETVTDANDFGNRLQVHTCRYLTRDINAEPPNGPSSCPFEFDPVYNPPFQA